MKGSEFEVPVGKKCLPFQYLGCTNARNTCKVAIFFLIFGFSFFIWGFRSACHSVFRVHERSEHLSGGRVQGLSLRVEDLESRIEV